MRKADYILEKFNEFEELTSSAQFKSMAATPSSRIAPRSGLSRRPIRSGPGNITHTPVTNVPVTPEHVAPKQIASLPSLEMPPPPSKISPKITIEPHTGGAIERATTTGGTVTLKFDPKTGTVLPDSIPKEWLDHKKTLLGYKTELKPEFQEAYNEAVKNARMQHGIAISDKKFNEKKIQDQETTIDTIARYWANWQSIPGKLRGSLITIVVLTGLYYSITKKSPKSSDPAIQKTIEIAAANAKQNDDIDSNTKFMEQLDKTSQSLSSTLETISNPKNKQYINNTIQLLNSLSTSLLFSDLQVDKSGMTEFASKITNLKKSCIDVNKYLPKLAKYFSNANRSDISEDLNKCISMADNYIQLIDASSKANTSSKTTASNPALESDIPS